VSTAPADRGPYRASTGDLRLSLCGDVMLTRRLAVFDEDHYLALRSLLREADGVFANFESTARRYSEGSPGFTEGTHMTTEPRLLEELKWLGVTFVSSANNHSYDYGEGGVLAGINALDEARIPHAGTGADLGAALAPAYVDTRSGRIALIACTATFGDTDRAIARRTDLQGKPGVNALGFETSFEVEQGDVDALRRIGQAIGLDAERARRRAWFYAERGLEPESSYRFLGRRFATGARPALRTTADARDLDAQVRMIREARRQADRVIVSVHCHEQGGATRLSATSQPDLTEPAEFLVASAHAFVEAGADIVACHGPHRLLGIEIHRGRPIFYSLGNFVMQNETVQFLPTHSYERFGLGAEATPADFLDARSAKDTKAHAAHSIYWESVVATCRYAGGALREVTLHPVDLGFGQPRAQRGRPVLADRAVGERILADISRMSAPLGTTVRVADGIGRIEVGA
jgi:poly-gamma-glutamate synthesis protein (capsule biosynthesis protein)